MSLSAAPELLEPGALITLSTCVTLTLLATNTLRYVFGLRARWIALALALAVSLLSTAFREPNDWRLWALTIPNALVIYTSSAGIAGMAAAKRPSGGLSKSKMPVEELHLGRRFWSPWFSAGG